jgi:hypothetical protein
VRWFNRLYLEVTRAVRDYVRERPLRVPGFLERLDVVFAGLFFAALDEHARAPGRGPAAWAPLFSARSQRGIAPLQFAFAGMNAHINRDLPLALVSTCDEVGVALRRGSPEHADFERVNDVLARVEAQERRAEQRPARDVEGPARLL